MRRIPRCTEFVSPCIPSHLTSWPLNRLGRFSVLPSDIHHLLLHPHHSCTMPLHRHPPNAASELRVVHPVHPDSHVLVPISFQTSRTRGMIYNMSRLQPLLSNPSLSCSPPLHDPSLLRYTCPSPSYYEEGFGHWNQLSQTGWGVTLIVGSYPHIGSQCREDHPPPSR